MELIKIVEKMCCNYGSFIMLDDLLQRVKKDNNRITKDDLRKMVSDDEELYMEGERVYLERVWQQEEFVAEWLCGLLQRETPESVNLPEKIQMGNIILTEEQRDAVALCLSNYLSLLLGKPGSGKTTISEAIIQYSGVKNVRLCSPTAKAAITLSDRTGCQASTLHRGLNVHNVNEFLVNSHSLAGVDLLIVDEGSMITIDMLGGILRNAEKDCRIVIIGDENQLPAVGPGNVIHDLLELNIPCAKLCANHRQAMTAVALKWNVEEFKDIRKKEDFKIGDSFKVFEDSEERPMHMIVEEAISRYKRGQDVRVLTYFRRDVWTINKGIQSVINPCVPGKQTLYRCGDENDQEFTFVDGDYVVFKKNSDKKGYYNGQSGILHIRNDQSYYVEISNGCNIDFPSDCPPNMLLPAYATTIHRAQGGQFDSVLLYIPYSGKTLNNRNTIYTGISRAKQELVLYSSKGAVSFGLQQTAPTRNSTLVAKTYSQFFAA